MQTFQPFDIIAADKNINMLAYVALLGKNPVAQSIVPLPKRIECVADCCKVTGQMHFDLAAGEGFEMTAKMNS